MPLPPLTATFLATALTASGGCFLFGGTTGSGTEATEDRAVDDFTEIRASGVYRVEAAIGPETSVTIVADDNILPLIHTEVRNGRLRIDTDGSIRPKVQPVIRVTAPSLEAIQTSGATKIFARDLRGKSFTLETSGASKATLSGAVDELGIEVSGAADISAADLTAETAEVEVSGAGKVDLTVTQSLDVEVSGAGKVTYGGDPATVNKDVSGAGKVTPR